MICVESLSPVVVHLARRALEDHQHTAAQLRRLLHQLAMVREICLAVSWLVKVKLVQAFHHSQHHKNRVHHSTKCHSRVHQASNKARHHHRVHSSQVHTDHQCRMDIQHSHRSQQLPQEELLSVKMGHQEEDQVVHQRLRI